ncbi:MAG: DUF1385 domain-containing protein [Actinomycetota bacterium]|nr:DUF1385 domain-containing protein [Actinomycetota bacterium]
MTRAPGALVGGQAVIEGVMVRAPQGWAVAVRRPDGTIEAVSHPLPRLSTRVRLARMPFVRGVLVLAEAMTLGLRALSWSAQKAVGEEEEPITGRQLAFTMAAALAVFLALFILLPALAAEALPIRSSLAFNLVEGLLRIGLFLGYIWAIGRSGEIRRVFQYHGAEHKTIHAYENGDPLGVERVQRHPTLHPRCGTNFLLIVLLLSIFVFALLGKPGVVGLVVSRVVLVPVIAAVAYEVIKLAARREERGWLRALMAPGLALQRLTTAPPDDQMVEVAITSLLAALDAAEVEEVKARGPVCPVALAALSA